MVIIFVGTLCLLLSEYCAILSVNGYIYFTCMFLSLLDVYVEVSRNWELIAIPMWAIPIATYFHFHSNQIPVPCHKNSRIL